MIVYPVILWGAGFGGYLMASERRWRNMPELPEVEMARRYLQATALHQTIRAAEVKDERILARVSATELRRPWSGSSFTVPCGTARGSF